MTNVSRRRATSKDSAPFGKRVRDGDTCQAQIVHRNTIWSRIANAGPPFWITATARKTPLMQIHCAQTQRSAASQKRAAIRSAVGWIGESELRDRECLDRLIAQK